MFGSVLSTVVVGVGEGRNTTLTNLSTNGKKYFIVMSSFFDVIGDFE